jgi:predicted nucleotidyltransferase
MLPEFDENGNLPKGVHKCTLQEVGKIFGTRSARRKWLTENLEKIVGIAGSTGKLERVFIWGSFVSTKEFPQDVDLLLVVRDDFAIDKDDLEARKVFDHVEAKIAFSADVFWTRSSIGEEIMNLWLETYQMTRDFEPRGILEVVIND